MDLEKLKIWQSGLTKEEREALREQEKVEKVFKEERDSVNATMRTKGFMVIMRKIKADMEMARAKLLRCNKNELDRLQLEIKVRKEFLDKWTPYVT